MTFDFFSLSVFLTSLLFSIISLAVKKNWILGFISSSLLYVLNVVLLSIWKTKVDQKQLHKGNPFYIIKDKFIVMVLFMSLGFVLSLGPIMIVDLKQNMKLLEIVWLSLYGPLIGILIWFAALVSVVS
jgi:hypothetical protein